MHEDWDYDLWLGKKDKASLDKKQFGPWMRAEMDYSSRKSWSSEVGSEWVEVSQSRQSMPPLVKECPIGRLLGIGAGVPRFEKTQPDKVTRVGEFESILHAKPLFDDSIRFYRTL